MASKTRNTPKERAPHAPSDGPARRWQLTAGLLAAAAGVIGGAIYLAVSPTGPSAPQPIAQPGPSEAERTRRAVEDLLASADKLPAKGGPQSLLLKRKGYESACELAHKYIRLSDPRDVVVRPALAKGLLRLGKMAEAERVVDTLLRLAPQLGEALWLKGELLDARGDARAMTFFRQAAEDDQAPPTLWARFGSELVLRGQLEQGRQFLLRAERAGVEDRQVLLGLAMLAMRDDRYERAEALLTRLAGRGRPSPRTLLLLAEARKYTDKLPEAERALRQALEIDNSPAVQLKLGDVLVLQKRRAEAAELYAQAAGHAAIEAVASYKAAQCYYLLGQYALAMKYIDRASAAGENPDVAAWRKKIEDARFGEPTGTGAFDAPAPGPVGTARELPLPPAVGGGLLGELLRAERETTTQPAEPPEEDQP